MLSAERKEHEVSDGPMGDWEAALDDLGERRSAGRATGGEERLAKHRGSGELDRAHTADKADERPFTAESTSGPN